MFVPLGDEIRTRTFPFVNVAVILVNIAAFLYYAVARDDYGAVVEAHGFTISRWTVPQVFTSMFLHGDLLHLAGNMLFLAITGDNVEDRFGHVAYLFFYFFSGLAAIVAHAVFSTAAMASIPVIGASGAVSGVLGAYLVLFPFHNVRMLAVVIPVKVPAFVFIGLWVATQWMIKRAMDEGHHAGIAVWAHLGGFAFGFAVTLLARMKGSVKAPPKTGS